MRAILLDRYGSPDDLHVREVEKPSPRENEVLIRVHAASVNDWDWGIVRGKPFYMRLICGLFKPNIAICGVDAAGVVEAVGESVSKWKPGDMVYGDLSDHGFGAFAEYVCAPEYALTAKPAAMSFAEAAAMPHAAALAMQGLIDLGGLQPGQRVMINGAGGGVGTLGVQIARSMGATVDGVDHGDKLEMMRSLGFERVFDYTRVDFTENEYLYDLILDTKTTRPPSRFLRVLKPGGQYVTVGGQTGRLLQTAAFGPLLGRRHNKRVRVLALKPNKDLQRINDLYEAGNVRPVLDGPFTLREAPAAIARFGEGRHLGKVIIDMATASGGENPGNA